MSPKNFLPVDPFPRWPQPFKPQGFPQSQFWCIQLERSNMPAQVQNSEACKKYVEIPLSGGEKNDTNMYMIMNTT